jgi:hypothetical protein
MRRVGDVLVTVLCLTFLLRGCAAKTTGVSDNTSAAPVPIAVFLSESCGECREVSTYLDQLAPSGTPLKVHRYSFEDLTRASLRHALDLACGVPEEQWYLVPAVFVGRTALIRGDIIEGQLPEIIRQTTSEDAAFLQDQLEATQPASNVPRQQADDAHRASCMMVVFAPLPLLGLPRQPHRQPKD